MLKIGHRGASGYAPENTIEAFQKAIALGADGIEFDVHFSADQQLVVIHDDTVDRTTSGTGKVASLTSEELQRLKMDNESIIPTVAQVFDLSDSIIMNVELKGENTADPVAKMIQKYVTEKNRDYSQFLVSSFDWHSLRYLRHQYPNIPLGVLSHSDINSAIDFAISINAESIHPNFQILSKSALEVCCENRINVFVWTVNNINDIQKVKAMAPQGIITDFLDRL